MAEPKFKTVLYEVWRKGTYSRKFTMKLISEPRQSWEIKDDASGKRVAQGDSTEDAKASLAGYLGVKSDEIKPAILVRECWEDSKLVYEIRVKRGSCKVYQVYDSTGNPVRDVAFGTYTKARSWCVNNA